MSTLVSTMTSTVRFMNMLRCVNWEFVNGNSLDVLLHNDWIWNLDWHFDWIGHLNFDDFVNFYDLVFGNFLVVMLVNCFDWNLDTFDVDVSVWG